MDLIEYRTEKDCRNCQYCLRRERFFGCDWHKVTLCGTSDSNGKIRFLPCEDYYHHADHEKTENQTEGQNESDDSQAGIERSLF